MSLAGKHGIGIISTGSLSGHITIIAVGGQAAWG
jgi:hypothetical protein